jgi:hypothetical protein
METTLVSVKESTTTKTPHSNGFMPHTDSERVLVAELVAAMWKQSGYTIGWTDAEELLDFSSQLSSTLNLSKTRFSVLSQTSENKGILKKEIVEKGGRLKDFVRGLFGRKEGQLKFGEFGFVHQDKKYEFPGTDSGFVQAVADAASACEKYQILSPEFGKPFWDTVSASFSDIVIHTRTQTGNITQTKVSKQDLRDKMDRIFRAVSHRIQAEHPDNFRDILRQWGFKRT